MESKKNSIKFAIKNGFVHIFSANFINKIVQFGIMILLVRVIDKKSFGSFSYAQNTLNMFLLLQGIGAVPAILQYCSSAKNEEERSSYFKYGLKVGLTANFLISFAILVFTLFFSLNVKGSTEILMGFFLFPLFSIVFDEIQVFLRASLRNKEFSYLTTLNSILYLIGNLGFGILFKIKGIIISRYIAYFITIVMGIYMIRKILGHIKNIPYPELKKRREFLKFAVTSSVTNAISQILILIDTYLVGVIIKDQSIVASYKTATLIPFNLTFIPASIIVFVYPYFAKNSDNKDWIRKKYNDLQKYLFILNGIISLILVVFAPQIVKIIFGTEYLDCVPTFRILSLGYLIVGTFRIPGGNILFCINKVKVNFYNAIISGVFNIILDIFFILKYGAVGAAIATFIIYVLSSAISNIYLYKYLKK
ncbi:oligosaccharide flippase family protein [Haloimpatiens sp. FM7315]|uniref:oligosaccharide flippase family protein n=1 Tax=Haloimpatiens sp. FM7315 TaxID=3298609 RepID=UPI00370B85B9